MASKRITRAQEFIGKSFRFSSSISGDLVFSANLMLEQALDERRGQVYRLAATHYTSHAVAAVVLVVTAFEAFLNETYDVSSHQVPWAREWAASRGLLEKYQGLIHVAAPPGATFDTSDLEMLIDTRHEIAHYLPRPKPALVDALEVRGLLMSTPKAPTWDMGQKLGSYALAYWAFSTIEEALARFVASSPPERSFSAEMAQNFSLYRRVACPPAQLPEFDAHYELTLTEASL